MSDRLALAAIGAVSAAVVGAVAALLLGGPAAAGPRPGVSALPTVNALLNATSAALLTAGFVAIRRRRVAVHRACMLSALGVSTLFLVSYVVYHAAAGSVPFRGQGWIRPVYFTILLSHIVLAAGIVPLALATVWRALRGEFARHVPLARWTLPLWLYVSVSGVVVYWMLYRLAP